jgi:hypothetical protein
LYNGVDGASEHMEEIKYGKRTSKNFVRTTLNDREV